MFCSILKIYWEYATDASIWFSYIKGFLPDIFFYLIAYILTYFSTKNASKVKNL